jgi:hypothetical protein
MDTRAHAYAPFYYLTETAKANNVNSYEEVWYLLTKLPLCIILEDWDNQIPWTIYNNEMVQKRK